LKGAGGLETGQTSLSDRTFRLSFATMTNIVGKQHVNACGGGCQERNIRLFSAYV
jgi:hypothetical protein